MNKKNTPNYRNGKKFNGRDRFLHISASCGMRDVKDKDGVITQVPWVNRGTTYRKM